jgi:hypothetical protein
MSVSDTTRARLAIDFWLHFVLLFYEDGSEAAGYRTVE